MSAIVVINEGVCLGRGRGQFSAGVVLVIKRFHRESDILVDPSMLPTHSWVLVLMTQHLVFAVEMVF